MKNERILVCFTLASLAVACSSSSSNNGGDAGNDSSSTGTNTSSGGTGTGLPPGDGGFGLGMSTLNCFSAADCTDGGPGQLCCYSLKTMTAACEPGPCAAGTFTQCAGSNSECPSGLQCVVSPLGMGAHYCAMGDGGASEGGSAPADGGVQADGAASEGGSGLADGAADAGAG